MEKEFVPYELALRLKALGFDKLCFGWYFTDQTDKVQMQTCHNYCGWLRGNNCSAPTFSQVFRWFREKGEDSILLPTSQFYTPLVYNERTSGKKKELYDTYEEAELACLEKLLEIVESKSK